MLTYLRGARRAELQTRDGRVAFAGSVRLALEDGGVTCIKLGQVLATRRDLLPAEFVDEFSGLQDDAHQVPWPEQLSPTALRKRATDELISLMPMLRRLPQRLDRITGESRSSHAAGLRDDGRRGSRTQ